jgi:hypothetical protein
LSFPFIVAFNLRFPGASVESSSGQVEILTPNAGVIGVSGDITLSTGSASVGNSGTLFFSSGDSSAGAGGELSFAVGTGRGGDGGTVRVTGGETADEASTGGDVLFLAGEGSNTYSIDGGNGGAGAYSCIIIKYGFSKSTD